MPDFVQFSRLRLLVVTSLFFRQTVTLPGLYLERARKELWILFWLCKLMRLDQIWCWMKSSSCYYNFQDRAMFRPLFQSVWSDSEVLTTCCPRIGLRSKHAICCCIHVFVGKQILIQDYGFVLPLPQLGCHTKKWLANMTCRLSFCGMLQGYKTLSAFPFITAAQSNMNIWRMMSLESVRRLGLLNLSSNYGSQRKILNSRPSAK